MCSDASPPSVSSVGCAQWIARMETQEHSRGAPRKQINMSYDVREKRLRKARTCQHGRAHVEQTLHQTRIAWSRPWGCSWTSILLSLCSLCLPCSLQVDSQGDLCGHQSSTITALLLQKKGPETVIFEANVSTGVVTGLRMAMRLHDQTIAGLAVDPVRQVAHVLTAAAGSFLHTLDLKNEEVSYAGSIPMFRETLLDSSAWPARNELSAGSGRCMNASTSNNSNSTDCTASVNNTESQGNEYRAAVEIAREEVRNVWNLVAWENQGLLLAVAPRDSGFNSSVLLINPFNGRTEELQVSQGSPVRGIYTFDRKHEKYYFVTTARRQRNLVEFSPADRWLSVKSLSDLRSDLVGLHYDENHCRLLAVLLLSPGILSVQKLDLMNSIVTATELSSLTEAASPSAKAFELVGMTSLLAAQDGTYIICRDPRSATINVYNVDAENWYAIDVANEGIVALQGRVRLNPTISSIRPLEVGMAGSSAVTVFGADFGRADMSPDAHIGATISQEVTWTSDSAIVVIAPPSPLKSAEFRLALSISGQLFSTETKVNYVPSWNSFRPTEGSVVGGQTLSVFGARFGAGQFECKFGDIITGATAYGVNLANEMSPGGIRLDIITCQVPAWPHTARMVQVELLINNMVIKRDIEGLFSYVAGRPAKLSVLAAPGHAFGGHRFALVVALQDAAGNTVLTYNGALRVQILVWSDSEWSEVSTEDNFVQGRTLESALDGVAHFNISIARHGTYVLNVSTEECYCTPWNCSDDDPSWESHFGHTCDSYSAGGLNDFASQGLSGQPCVFDGACEPCACRCADQCGYQLGQDVLSTYGICNIDPSDIGEFTYPRQVRAVESPCLAVETQVQVKIGQVALLTVNTAGRALAAHILIPQPRVEILDSGGNIANVHVKVLFSVVGAASSRSFSGSYVNSSAGVAIFTDIQISQVGSFTLVFYIEGGLSVDTIIDVVHSSPAYLFNAGLYPSRSYTSMQPMEPYPTIWILDEGGNRISNGLYWIQDEFGIMASRPLNISIRASLMSVLEITPATYHPFQTPPPLFSLPDEINEPVGNLYGTTHVSVVGQSQGGARCPSNCSGHGHCENGECSCMHAWRGAGCQLPDVSVSCGEDCPQSGLGIWENGACHCLANSITTVGTQQVGSEASFSELLVDTQGKGYVLSFNCEGLQSAQSFAFAIEPGVARHLYVTTHPMNGTGGEGLFHAPVVEIHDAGKNIVHSGGQGGRRNISVELVGNFNGTLIGVHVRLAIEGQAVFKGLKVDRISGDVPYVLKFTSEDLIEAFSYPFDIRPGSPHVLKMVQQPKDGRGGLPLAVQPQLQLLDAGGNKVPVSGGSWTLTAKTLNMTLHGTVGIPFVDGLASFTDLQLDVLGRTYILFDGGRNLEPINSDPFNVTAGPPASVNILVQPGNGIGGMLIRQPIIKIMDGGGNLIEQEANITVAAMNDLGRYFIGIYKSTTNTMNFTDLKVFAPAPSTYRLVFSVFEGQEHFSDLFNLSIGSPFKLSMLIQPNTSSLSGQVLQPPPAVAVVDRAGNLVSEYHALITVSLNASSSSRYQNPFVTNIVISSNNASGCDMSETAHEIGGSQTVPTIGGIATFTNLNVGLAGLGYRLNFVSSLLQSVDSDTFEVLLGLAPARLHVLCHPQHGIAGIGFDVQPVLQVLDLGGNRMHGQVVEATASLLSPSPSLPGLLSGKLTSILHGDVMTFTDLSLDTAGEAFRIKFVAHGLQSTTSNPITISRGVAVALNVDLNKAVRVHETFNVSVSVRDRGGNSVPPAQAVNISAQLYSVQDRVFTVNCTGLHSCQTNVDLTLPQASKLLSVSLSMNMSCTDFDSANEAILGVTVGTYRLEAGFEFNRGPWQGCFRNCLDSRTVMKNYDAMGKFCWDSQGLTCNKLLYNRLWDGIEPRWNFLSRMLSESQSVMPIQVEVPDSVNFNPCDGNFVNAVVEVRMQYISPDQDGLLGGQKYIEIDTARSSVVFNDFALQVLNQRFVLGFSADGLHQTFTDVFVLAAGQVKSLKILQQPGNGTGNSVLDKQPVLELLDFGSNRVMHASSSAYTIQASLLAPCPPDPVGDFVHMPREAKILGSSSIHPLSGLAEFTDLLVGQAYPGYIMLFRLTLDDSLDGLVESDSPTDDFFVGNYLGIVNSYVVCSDCFCSTADRPCISCAGPAEPAVMVASSIFSVVNGEPSGLIVDVEPSDGFGGEALPQQPVIRVVDMGGNFISDFSGTLISAHIEMNGGLIGKLSGNLTAPVTAGIAQFSDLAIDKAGVMYTLSFSSAVLTSATSASFNIMTGSAYRVVMLRQPSDGKRDLLLNTQPAVAIQDRGGNKVASWVGTISVALYGGTPFHPALDNGLTAQLSGTLEGFLWTGAAYWNNLRIDKAGTGYRLKFTATGVEGCVSSPFLISGHAATYFQFVSHPTIARASLSIPDIVVAALDPEGDPDVTWNEEVSIELGALPLTTVELVHIGEITWSLGMSVVKNIIVSAASDEAISVNLRYRNDVFVSGEIRLIDPFTGWWNLTYAGADMQLSVRGGHRNGITSGVWTDASSLLRFSFRSDYSPRFEAKGNDYCMTFTSTIKSLDDTSGGAEGSMFVSQCRADNLFSGHISTRTSHFFPSDEIGSWARDVQYFSIEEHYPRHDTSYYVLVANGFNASSRSSTANSAIYKWQGGKLNLYQEFPDTKSAFSVRYFQMGMADYVIIANHFDDQGNGFGVPSVLYRHTWVTGKYAFVPVQSISTEGAVAWDYFEVNGESYMVVANYFNGSHFTINSTVYAVVRNSPDASTPGFQQLQAISTNGARDVGLLSMAGSQYLAFANWYGHTVDVYVSHELVPHFSLFQTLEVGPATGVELFTINAKVYLAVSISDSDANRLLSKATQVYILNSDRNQFEPLQNIQSFGLQKIVYFSDGLDFLLSAVELSDGENLNARTQVYRWNGTHFEDYLRLPTRNASAVAIMDVPCEYSGGLHFAASFEAFSNDYNRFCMDTCNETCTQDCDRLYNDQRFASRCKYQCYLSALRIDHGTCSQKGEQRLIMTVNGRGKGAEVFAVSRLESRSIATHLKFLSFYAYDPTNPAQNPTLNQTLFPAPQIFPTPPQVDVYNLQQQQVHVAWNVPVKVDIQVYNQDSPYGGTIQRKFSAFGDTAAYTNALGQAYFFSLRTTISGSIKLHAFNDFLSDLPFGMSDQLTIVPAADYQLMLGDVAAQAISGDVFTPLISVHDVFGNFKKYSNTYTVNSTLFVASPTILMYNTTMETENGVARFGILFFGNNKRQKIKFTAAGLKGVVSSTFDIVGKCYVKDLGARSIPPGATAVTITHGGVLMFGGMISTSTATNSLFLVEANPPFEVQHVAATGQIPPARINHAALIVDLPFESMIVLGGHDGDGLLYNDVYYFKVSENVWTQLTQVSFPARAYHSVVNAIVRGPDPYLPSMTQETSLIVIFGGINASGQVVDDIIMYKVMPTFLEDTLYPPVVSGDKPSARSGAFMTWEADRGYLFGGRNIDDNSIYSFNITAPDQYFYVTWTMLQASTSGGSPHPLVVSPLRFLEKLYIISKPTTNPISDASKAEMLALDPGSFGKSDLLTVLPFPDVILNDYYELAKISEGTALIFSSNFTSLSTHAYIISLVSSVALRMQYQALQVYAGLAVFPAPSVTIVDSNGDVVRDFGRNFIVRVSAFDSNMNTIPMSGDTEVQAVNGVALFDFIVVEGGSTGVHFVFESDSIHGVSSASFDVMQGPLAKLSILQIPDGVYRGAPFSTQPAISLEDVAGSRVLDNSYSVVSAFLEFREAPEASWAERNSWLTGTKQQSPTAGYLRFNDLGISPDSQEGYYRITFRIPGIVPGIAEFSVGVVGQGNETAGPETIAFLSIQPVACTNKTKGLSSRCRAYLDYARNQNALIAGVPLLVQPSAIVKIPGASSLFSHGPNIFFDIELLPAIHGRSDLNGTQRQELYAGMLNFTDISVNPASRDSLYRLQFSSSILPTAQTVQFAVVPGTPARISILRGAEGALAGLAFSQQPVILVSDVAENSIAISVPITAQLQHSTSNAALRGNLVATTNLGTAEFTDLTVDPIGTGFSIHFELYDSCCGSHLDVESPRFNVSHSGQASLEEISPPGGAIAGEAFASQPSVAIRDFGGNLLSVTGTVVTASLERDSTSMILPPKVILASRATVSRVQYFKVNGTEYLLVANLFDGTTYKLNATLHVWDATNWRVTAVQQVPTEGAEHLTHFVSDDVHYIIIANGFEVVSIESGVIEGTYNTLSKIYRMDVPSGKLVFVASIPTHGAKATEVMQIGDKILILVANNYNDNTTDVASAMYIFNPNGSNTNPHIVKIQELPTTAASFFHYFRGNEGEDLVISAQYYNSVTSSYIAESIVFRYAEGKLERRDSILTSGVVSIKSFDAGGRKYVLFGNRFGLNSTIDPGVVVVYEHLQGQFIWRQELTGFKGLSDIEYFHANGAEWLVVTTDPKLSGSALPGAFAFFSWDTSNCSTSQRLCNIMVDFKIFEQLPCNSCRTTTQFASGWNNHYVLSASANGLSVVTFYSEAALYGNMTAISVDGKAVFSDLYMNLRATDISLSYRSRDLSTAYGKLFSVDYGSLESISADTRPLHGIGGIAFSVQPMIVLRDLGGNLMPFQHDGNYVHANIALSGGQPTHLVGSTTALIQNGSALFTNLGLSLATWHILNFTYSLAARSTLFDSFNVSVVVGRPHHMKTHTFPDFLFGGLVFGQQPAFTFHDKGDNFVSAGSVKLGVTIKQHVDFDMRPFLDNTAFKGLISTGVEFFSYMDLAYVIAFGKGAVDGKPSMKLYKWGCESLIPIQSWNISVLQVSFFRQNNTTWMVTLGTDSSCVIYSFDPTNERYLARDSFKLQGAHHILPTQLGGNQLHLIASVDTMYDGTAGVLVLRLAEIHPAGFWSSDPRINSTLQVNVIQKISSTLPVLSLKGFNYMSKDWLLLATKSSVHLYRWGEYLEEYFHLHDSKTVTEVHDMALYFTAAGRPPSIALAGQPSVFIDLDDITGFHGISLQSMAGASLPFEAKRIRATTRGDMNIFVVASTSEVAILEGNRTTLNLTWHRPTSSNVTAVEWGRSHGILHLIITGAEQAVYRLSDRGKLSGTTIVTSNNGVASFTDLQIDLLGQYTLSFAAFGLQNEFFFPGAAESYRLQSQTLTVRLGIPSAVVTESNAKYGITPMVKLVDGGGNEISVGKAVVRFTGATVVLSDVFNISGSIVFDTSNMMHSSCILACKAQFLKSPTDGMLWHFGGGAGTEGAWLGIRGSSTSPVLRFRVGSGDEIETGQSSTNVSYIDITDFPKDGNYHTVVADIALDYQGSSSNSRLWLRLYIDGELKGSSYIHSHSWVGSSSVHSFAVHADDGDIPAGEPNIDWPGGTSKNLILYQGTTWGNICDKSVLLGDWAAGSMTGIQYICCDSYFGCPKVTAVLDNPSQMKSTEQIGTLYSTGVRDIEHFVIGTRHFVAVANNFDGTSYLLDSVVLEWKNSGFERTQGLATQGAYDFEFFTMFQTNTSRDGPGVRVEEHYLAVANHFDDVEGYSTLSTIYKWNASTSKFLVYQNIETEGATKWEGFKIEGIQYLVVSNFFDGTFHSVDSVLYKWSEVSKNFSVAQSIPTVGAHSVQHIEYEGDIFCFFAQFRQADEVSMATESIIYMWDTRTAQLRLLTSFASSAAMFVEPFQMSGDLYFSVANYANSTTSSLITQSTVYKLSCRQGVYQPSLLQSIPTYGGAVWKHFTRGGIHYLAISNWKLGTQMVCDGVTSRTRYNDGCKSSIDVYIWNGTAFELYYNAVTDTGVVSFDVVLIGSRYHLLSAMAEESNSLVSRFGAGLSESDLANYTGIGYLWEGPTSFPGFDEWLKPHAAASSVAQQAWGIEFVSLPLVGAATGPYYNASTR